MKKTISILTAILLIFGIYTVAFAKTDYSDLYDGAEDIKPVENEILEHLNHHIYPEYEISMTMEDLDSDGILKIYNTYSILFMNKDIDESEFDLELQNFEHFYRIFYHKKDIYAEELISKGEVITDEMRENLNEESLAYFEKNSGKWHVSSCGYDQKPNPNYKQNIEKVIKNSGTKYTKIDFLAYLSGNLFLTAKLTDENSEVRYKILEGVINEEMISSNCPDDTLYTFEELKEIAAQYVPQEGYAGLSTELTGVPTSYTKSDNTKIIIAAVSAGAVIIAVSAIIIVCIKKKKASAETDN